MAERLIGKRMDPKEKGECSKSKDSIDAEDTITPERKRVRFKFGDLEQFKVHIPWLYKESEIEDVGLLILSICIGLITHWTTDEGEFTKSELIIRMVFACGATLVPTTIIDKDHRLRLVLRSLVLVFVGGRLINHPFVIMLCAIIWTGAGQSPWSATIILHGCISGDGCARAWVLVLSIASAIMEGKTGGATITQQMSSGNKAVLIRARIRERSNERWNQMILNRGFTGTALLYTFEAYLLVTGLGYDYMAEMETMVNNCSDAFSSYSKREVVNEKISNDDLEDKPSDNEIDTTQFAIKDIVKEKKHIPSDFIREAQRQYENAPRYWVKKNTKALKKKHGCARRYVMKEGGRIKSEIAGRYIIDVTERQWTGEPGDPNGKMYLDIIHLAQKMKFEGIFRPRRVLKDIGERYPEITDKGKDLLAYIKGFVNALERKGSKMNQVLKWGDLILKDGVVSRVNEALKGTEMEELVEGIREDMEDKRSILLTERLEAHQNLVERYRGEVGSSKIRSIRAELESLEECANRGIVDLFGSEMGCRGYYESDEGIGIEDRITND